MLRELPRSALSSLWRDEHVTVESIETLAGRVEAKATFTGLPHDDAGNILSGAIDGVSFRHEISFGRGGAAAVLHCD